MPGMICDVSEVLKAQDDLVNKQLPFATARALTLTAQDAQAAIRTGMQQRFTIRNAWSQRGIIVKPADKNVIPARSAVMVGDIWNYLFLQESGGEKTPTSSLHIAVPEDIRSSPTQILRRQLRPRALLARKDVFIKDLGGGNQAIYQRVGKGGRNLKLLYILVSETHVKPRLGLAETAQKIGNERWAINFAASLEAALISAR
jgi:hypothetical protein